MMLPASPGRGRYLVKRLPAYLALRLVDFCLKLFVRRHAIDRTFENNELGPGKILICNGAHLGDLILSTAIIRPLRTAFPGAKLGFLCGSWARSVLNGNPDLAWIHEVDHWKLNRSAAGRFRKLLRYFQTRRTALAELKAVKYDIAVDLYFFFPNSALLLRQAGIPRRVGYTSGGFGDLYSHARDWEDKDQSIVFYHLDLLKLLPGSGVSTECESSPSIRLYSPSLRHAESDRFLRQLTGGGDYLLFHICAGNPVKEWPATCWTAVLRQLADLQLPIIFTGSGTRESYAVESVISGIPYCHSACNKLEWRGFVSAISGALLVVTADSVAAHVAAAAEVPCIVIGHGINNPHHWRPLSDNAMVLRHGVPCSPCYRSRGCESMACVRGISAETVERGIRSQLGGERESAGYKCP